MAADRWASALGPFRCARAWALDDCRQCQLGMDSSIRNQGDPVLATHTPQWAYASRLSSPKLAGHNRESTMESGFSVEQPHSLPAIDQSQAVGSGVGGWRACTKVAADRSSSASVLVSPCPRMSIAAIRNLQHRRCEPVTGRHPRSKLSLATKVAISTVGMPPRQTTVRTPLYLEQHSRTPCTCMADKHGMHDIPAKKQGRWQRCCANSWSAHAETNPTQAEDCADQPHTRNHHSS